MVTLVVLVGIYIPILFSDEIRNAFYTYGQKENTLIVQGEWWRLITATLLHGPPYHILFNGYALYILGNDLEAFFGRWRFLAVYWLSALAGSVASFAFSPAPSIGASGAVFGLIGALAVYFGMHRKLFGRMGQAQFWNIIVVIVLNIGLGLSQIFPIDNSAHIGGLVAGAAVGLALCPQYAFGNWRAPNVREVRNINYGRLTWIAVALIALDILFAFFVALLLYQKGYWQL
jgi:rhomboid protease GluP